MEKIPFNFFDDYNKLLHYSLIFYSIILTADITSIVFYDRLMLEDFIDSLSTIKIISTISVYIVFTFVAVILYWISSIFRANLPSFLTLKIADNEDRNQFSDYALLNKAVKEDNSTMLSYYNDFQKDKKLKLYMKYTCLLVLFLIIIELRLDQGIIQRSLSKSENNYYISLILSITTISFIICVLYLIVNKIDYHTEITQEDNIKLKNNI